MRLILFGLIAGLFLLPTQPALSVSSNLPLPRFVSLKTDEVNVRTGPGLRYEILWVFVHDNMPLEVIAEYDQWRKVRDREGDEGWIHRSMLSNKRTVTVIDDDISILRKSSDPDSAAIARIEPGVHAELLGCEATHCRVEAGSYRGWLERDKLWGIYADEEDEEE